MIFFLQFTASLLLVAFGFPFIAAAVGYAFFWVSLTHRFQRIRDRFWVSVLWFGLVQAIQLSWFTSIEYMGPCILIVYALLVFLIGFSQIQTYCWGTHLLLILVIIFKIFLSPWHFLAIVFVLVCSHLDNLFIGSRTHMVAI